MDPHLACQDINLWGSGLADSAGTFTIAGWPPSGSKEQDYPASGSSTWSYNQSQGGSQAIAVISVQTLINTAASNGDTPKNKNGYHFKLNLLQDPQKHKTFWVSCPAPSTTGGSTGGTTGGSTGGTTGGSTGGTTGTTTGSSTPQSSGTSTTTKSSVKAAKKTRRKHHRKHRRHRHARKGVRAVRRLPSFTG
jgi:hypothetical protein